MVWWSFSRAGFRLNPDNFPVPHASTVPKLWSESVSQRCILSNSLPNSLLKLQHRRILAPIEFAVSLKACVDKMSRACPLCGDHDHGKSSEDKKRQKSEFCHFAQSYFHAISIIS
jgi:hypothetical protein